MSNIIKITIIITAIVAIILHGIQFSKDGDLFHYFVAFCMCFVIVSMLHDIKMFKEYEEDRKRGYK